MPRTITQACVAVAATAALAAAGLPASARPVRAQADPAPAGSAPAVSATAASAPAGSAAERAAANADAAVGAAASATRLRRAGGDTIRRTGVIAGTRGLHYVTYERTHQGLPVVGGDIVVTTDADGVVSDTAVAQTATVTVGTTPTVPAARAVATSRAKLVTVEETSAAKLVVLAAGATPRLAWETVVTGRGAGGRPSVLHVWVDAASGAVLDTRDDVREGTGNGYYYGQVTVGTSRSGSSYTMTDPTRRGLRCGGQSGSAFTGADDAWGNGTGSSLETACVDALWGAQREIDMLQAWLGRDGVKGDGTNPPIRVGLPDDNAYWNGSFVNFGHNRANTRQLTPIDVVAHELGHAIFQFTPGGAGSSAENGGINEATGDIFGALTEAYANSPLDPPDYQVGEEADLAGDGPIRYMYDPSLAGDPGCYSSAIPSSEVHAAAGPLNHWFYLAAEGSAPAGKPASPTCDGSRVTGLGIRKAGEIFYNALLAKTSTWRYGNVRTATLTAAKNLYRGGCAEFAVVKAAWAAVGVGAQPGEPACSAGTADFSLAVSPASGSVAPGGSATATVSTATTAGAAQTVALSATGLPGGATASFSRASVSSGGSATLTVATTAATPAGRYPITVTGRGAVTRTATYTLTVTGGGGGAGCSGTNGTDVAIPDAGGAVTSTVTIAGCGRAASATATAAVDIVHPYRGDVVIDLVAPDGTAYRLKNGSSVDGADNIVATFPVDLAGERADGAWKLSVRDLYRGDAGSIDTWTLTL